MTDISNSDDIIDSRDVIARIEELTDERDELQNAIDEAQEERDGMDDEENAQIIDAAEGAISTAQNALMVWERDNGDELKALESLAEEAEGYADDWKYGATLVRDSYWAEYVEEMLKDCGDLPKDIPSYIVIDWEATADNIRADYTSVSFDGIDYWVR